VGTVWERDARLNGLVKETIMKLLFKSIPLALLIAVMLTAISGHH
jgi:cell division protein FtsL